MWVVRLSVNLRFIHNPGSTEFCEHIKRKLGAKQKARNRERRVGTISAMNFEKKEERSWFLKVDELALKKVIII